MPNVRTVITILLVVVIADLLGVTGMVKNALGGFLGGVGVTPPTR